MGFRIAELFSHLNVVRSVKPTTLARRLISLLPDYWLTDGYSSTLVNITLELTYKCNLQCSFCFIKDVLNTKRAELTFDEIRGVVAQAKDLGAGFFLIGGDPFARRDAVDVVELMKSEGLRCGANTNGILLTNRDMDRLAASGMDYLIFSLNGPPEVHDLVTKVPGSFRRTMLNLEYMLAKPRRPRMVVNAVVAPQTYRNLDGLYESLIGRGLDAVTFQHESFVTDKEARSHEACWKRIFPNEPFQLVVNRNGEGKIDTDTIYDTQERIIDRAARDGMRVSFKPRLSRQDMHDWYNTDKRVQSRCSYIWTDTRISPEGNVVPCQFMPIAAGNVREQPLAEILNGDKYRAFRRENREFGGMFPACNRCCKLYRTL